MTEELMKKAKETKSVEELICLAKDNGIELTEKEAKEHFSSLHKSGEIEDDELDSVSGGACYTTHDGKKYTIVTSACKCFTGLYEKEHYSVFDGLAYLNWHRYSSEGCCGRCEHLIIDKGLGYCGVSAK